MKLLIDQNISRKIIPNIKSSYPNSAHVVDLGLENSTDKLIWEYAKEHNFIIVTFDADFYNFSVVWGFPPKIIWIRTYNQTTSFIEQLLVNYYATIKDFCIDENLSCLELKQLN
jgi:predicted nuclease of predicted toxin-antitoxin system